MKITKETYRTGLWTLTQDINGEEWKDVKGFENFYKISSLGRVKRVESDRASRNRHCAYIVHFDEKIIIPRVHTNGYLFVTLSANGKRKSYDVHRLVAETFLVAQENCTQVNHKDENVANNTVENLEWCTASYNQNYGTLAERKRAKMKNHPNTSKSVSQYTKDGKYVNTYPSINEAARVMDIACSNIIQCCNHTHLSAPPPSGNTSEQSRPTSETTRLATDGGSSKQKRILIYDDFNATFPKNQDVIGTVRQTFGAWAFTNGYKIFEIEDDDILPDRP